MNTRIDLVFRMALVLASVTAAAPLAAQTSDTDVVAAGRALFMQKGCYECHGTLGQGAAPTGAALAPSPIPLDAMTAYIRHPKGQMPDYSEKILSNDDIAKIHAYLASVPANPPLSSIPLLNGGAPANQQAQDQTAASVRHGATVYAANCAACHGAQGQGGAGPALKGISARYQTDTIEARIREPLGTMPKLYPAPLNANDVEDVARYVWSMK
jgi:ubiquinol-cytochrome c reductase cytochrome c subunit